MLWILDDLVVAMIRRRSDMPVSHLGEEWARIFLLRQLPDRRYDTANIQCPNFIFRVDGFELSCKIFTQDSPSHPSFNSNQSGYSRGREIPPNTSFSTNWTSMFRHILCLPRFKSFLSLTPHATPSLCIFELKFTPVSTNNLSAGLRRHENIFFAQSNCFFIFALRSNCIFLLEEAAKVSLI